MCPEFADSKMKQLYIKILVFFVLLLTSISAFAQGQVHGVVTDSLTNEPLAFISVYYDGKGVGSITDNDGKYSVETRQGWNKLTFSAVGYNTKVVPIIPGVTKQLNVKLSSSDNWKKSL